MYGYGLTVTIDRLNMNVINRAIQVSHESADKHFKKYRIKDLMFLPIPTIKQHDDGHSVIYSCKLSFKEETEDNVNLKIVIRSFDYSGHIKIDVQTSYNVI